MTNAHTTSVTNWPTMMVRMSSKFTPHLPDIRTSTSD
jgi:hypothetical protein